MRDVATDEARSLLHLLAVATNEASWRGLAAASADRVRHDPDLPMWQARVAGACAVLAAVSGHLGRTVDVDAVDVVTQRAKLRGLEPRGAVSAGGGCRLLPTRDDWVAMSLNRSPDWELMPALFRTEQAAWDWDSVTSAATQMSAADLEASAADLGLAVAVVPTEPPPVEQPWHITMSPAGPHKGGRPGRVVDLSALWAGPLCSSLLRRSGAEVTTVESSTRPDASRHGDPELHRLLHEGNTFVSLDFTDDADRDELRRLVGEADVVVSAARIRALQQLGLDPFSTVEQRPGLTWVGISAYGLTGASSNRIGYGDDAAVAGGLVHRGPTPTFVGDAVADPITGIYAALAALAVAASGGGVVDVALRDVAAHVARTQR